MNARDLAEFARLGTATVYEASEREGLIDVPLVQVVPDTRVAGPARTVACGQDDNLMVHAVMADVQPGEVLVLTMPEPRPVALIGELLVTQAAVRQASGLLVDASVRDLEELRDLGLPIWARYVRVRGASKSVAGSLNKPVSMGGTAISPGDVVVLDSDGAVAVKAERAAEILQASRDRDEREAALREKLRAGALSYDLHGLREVVERETRTRDTAPGGV